MTMTIAEQGQLICASASLVWDRLTQVNQWTQWYPGLKSAELLETPKPGAIGRVAPLPGRPFHFTISQFDPEKLLVLRRPYKFGTELLQTYRLTRNAEGVVLTVETVCQGVLELQVGFLTRRKMNRELLDSVLGLKTFCEKMQAEEERRSVKLAQAS